MSTKYIFVTGGVVSGLGKGITAASIGRLLKDRGHKVTIQKFDPYLNVDPGMMDPYEHGEVFVTDDGGETDLDLGHYERFIDESLTKESSVSMGQIYASVLEKERSGKYLGKTVQIVPHITNEIKEKMYSFENTDIDVVITEVGGTVGDIEGLSIIEAIRQISIEKQKEDVLFVHVTLLPYILGSNELKSKPTQHSVKELQSLGIRPDILVCRSEKKIDSGMKEKLALFCNVRKEDVIENKTSNILYEIPLHLEKDGIVESIYNHFNLNDKELENKNEWKELIKGIKQIEKNKIVEIALVGNYAKLQDAYISLIESLKHAGYKHKVNIEIGLIDSEIITSENTQEIFSKYKAIILTDGYGSEGLNGKLETVKYARENKIPFLGICLGMQIAVIEFAKNVLGIKNATSEEFQADSENNIIHIIKTQKEKHPKGLGVRLGSFPCNLNENTLVKKIYGKDVINERYKNRYELNNMYKEKLEEKGMICSGISIEENLVEVVELLKHPYFIGVQFNPEYKSRPNRPAPIFDGLIKAIVKS